MAPYDDWNKIDEEEDEELQDTSVSGADDARFYDRLTAMIFLSTLKGRKM
jgi:hypothetical protein